MNLRTRIDFKELSNKINIDNEVCTYLDTGVITDNLLYVQLNMYMDKVPYDAILRVTKITGEKLKNYINSPEACTFLVLLHVHEPSRYTLDYDYYIGLIDEAMYGYNKWLEERENDLKTFDISTIDDDTLQNIYEEGFLYEETPHYMTNMFDIPQVILEQIMEGKIFRDKWVDFVVANAKYIYS